MNSRTCAAYLMGAVASLIMAGLTPAQVASSAISTWTPARTPDGQPDIQGSWSGSPNGGGNAAVYDFELGSPTGEHIIQGGGNNNANRGSARDNKPPNVVEGGMIPYQPWARAVLQDNRRKSLNPTKPDDLDSYSKCLQMGVPRQHFLGAFRIIQAPGYVIISGTSSTRVIALDDRPHIDPSIKLWAGDSVGHWEGNTLVVDVTNISEHGYYDWAGNFHSSDLHLVERWTFTDANTLSYEAMNYDSRVFTRPWKLKNEFMRSRNANANAAFPEDSCYEGEKDVQIMLSNNADAERTQKK